ncbi:hypothetical protein [Oleidesulfovibrio sp.]|uniref:hypothetical protein n=1 Tax=Oleidesulfovibrio sp. TaxID=2909707 RepID=UPI003A86C3F7
MAGRLYTCRTGRHLPHICTGNQPTLLKHGQIEFPIAIESDLPFSIRSEHLEPALASGSQRQSRYLCIINVSSAAIRRDIYDAKGITSSVITGYKKEEHPEYLKAIIEIDRLKAKQGRSRGLYTFAPLTMALADALGTTNDVTPEEAYERLKEIPPYIETPVVKNYTATRLEMESNRSATVQYYLVDLHRKHFFPARLIFKPPYN